MMHFSKYLVAGMAAVAIGVPLAMTTFTASASADERDRYRDGRRYDRAERYERYERRHERRRSEARWRYRNNSYSARANDLDPAGDYKGYPDWARVALSPKYDRGFR